MITPSVLSDTSPKYDERPSDLGEVVLGSFLRDAFFVYIK